MKRRLTENLGLKISAVVLSVFLWLFVTSRGQSDMSIDVPLEFKNIPAGLGIVNMVGAPKSVSVAVRGQERLIRAIKHSDVRVFVDLAKAKKGEEIYFINKDDVRLPYAISLISVSPSSIRLKLDETVAKKVPVTASITGTPQKGFSVKSIDVQPRIVEVKGLKTDVRKVTSLKTEVFDITGLDETTTQELALDLSGANVSSEPGSVKVTVVITGRKR